MCLGHEDHVDLKAAFRQGGLPAVEPLIDRALRLKPAAHDFRIGADAAPAVRRHMSVTGGRSEEHTSELQSLMRISYAVFCLKKKTNNPRPITSCHHSW